ncbi:MAG: hypothetical protein WKF87_08300 [Chryseolinea sp.]
MNDSRITTPSRKGTVSYGKFSMSQLKVNYDYIIPISDSFNFNPGLSVGISMGKETFTTPMYFI